MTSLSHQYCYLGEFRDGTYLMAYSSDGRFLTTRDPEMAARHTADGIANLQRKFNGNLGSRKVIAG